MRRKNSLHLKVRELHSQKVFNTKRSFCDIRLIIYQMRRFEELEVLGDGAFGIVTKCRDRETGELVAIKKMKQRYGTFDECLQLKEVKSLRKIKHENVIRMFQVFRENDHLYLVFELLHGSLLKSLREHAGPFTEPEVRNVISQLLEGLAYIHRQGFFHRDIKPENLMWGQGDAECTLKIGDFGLAREIRSRPPYTEYISTRWYRAPEIVLRHEFYNSPVDIWAVGAIMAELYTLKPLFQGNSETDQIFKICSVLGTPGPNNWPDGVKLATRLGIRLPQFAPTSLSALVPNASPEAIDLMTELLRLDPARRPSATQALQHPFFTGAKTPVQSPVKPKRELSPKLVSSKPARVEPEKRMQKEEIRPVELKNPVWSFAKDNNPAPRRNKLQLEMLEDDEDIDDILDGLL